MKVCKACGLDNRGNANFCASCGSPLPRTGKKEAYKTDARHRKAVMRFWLIVSAVIVVLGAAGFAVMSYFESESKEQALKKYSEIYRKADEIVFASVTDDAFGLMGLGWGMNAGQIKMVYPHSVDSRDPDFVSAIAVNQGEFKVQVPHANFMSLGMYDGRLYAVKFEFGPTKVFKSEALKIPNIDERIYGRFVGLLDVFVRLYGRPLFAKDELKDAPAHEKIKHIKAGMVKGRPSNIYYFWEKGRTRVELVLFGHSDRLYLTTRFLYIPVWDRKGKQ